MKKWTWTAFGEDINSPDAKLKFPKDWDPPLDELQLYDLLTDPTEDKNLVASDPTKAKQLLKEVTENDIENLSSPKMKFETHCLR